MTTEMIYAHNIEYNWFDGKERDLSDCELEHIKKALANNYVEGELFYYDSETETEIRGWWKIKRD